MSATLGSRRFPDIPACPTCCAPVRIAHFLRGDQVEHYDPDASFRDSVWRHCRLSVATLPSSDNDGSHAHG